MTVQWTTIDVPLGAGVDTKTNEKLLKPPFAAELSDAVFPASGADGYETRLGYTRIKTATEPTDIENIFTRDNELVALADDKLYSVSELANNVDLLERGDLVSVDVQQSTLDTQSTNQTLGQIIEHLGVRVFCWYDSGSSTIKYTVSDIASDAIISANTSITSSTKAKLAKCGNSILLIYFNSSATSLRCVVIPVYNPTSTSDVELVTDAAPEGIFDCVEVDSSLASVFVAYRAEGTPDTVVGFLLDSGGSTSDVTTVDSNAVPVCMAVSVSWNAFHVIFADATDIFWSTSTGSSLFTQTAYAQATTAKANVINIAHEVGAIDGTAAADEKHTLFLEFTTIESAPFNVDRFNTVAIYAYTDTPAAILALIGTPTANLQQTTLASCAFLRSQTEYAFVNVCFDSALQNTYFLIDSDGTVQGKCCSGVGQGAISPHLPRVIDGIWAPVYREKLDLDLDPDEIETETETFSQFGLKRVKYDFSYKPSAVQYGRASYISSGILWQYDGRQLVEQGFLLYPELPEFHGVSGVDGATGGVTLATVGSALTVLSSYSYRIYYEWTNSRGERQRSSTGQILTVALTTTTDEVTISIPTLVQTHKGTDVSIVVYRTEADPNIVGGAPFYRVSSADPSTSGTDNGFIANNPAVATVDFVDAMTDTVLLTRELDYLNSGELDHVSPKSASIIGESKKRVWLAGFENGNRVQYSKLNSRGRDQLEFHDTQVLDVPEEDGDVTAFGALNFHTVIFKANSCYAVSGEGPNNLGGGFFNLPQIISLDVGCIEQKSIVNIPPGLMFKSNKGIWLIGHNLDAKYIGAPVEAYNSQDITAATVVPEENHVIFLTSSGRTLVYNYLVNAWSTFTNHTGNGAVVWNGTYVYARTNGRLYKQSPTAYTDDGVHYAMKFRTAPIGLKGTQGKQRIRHVRLLGTYYTPHNLRVGIRYDHEPGVSDSGTWNPSDGITISTYGSGAYGSGAYGGSGSPVYQARFNLPRQKCQVVQFEIDTTNTGNAGRAVSIQAIQIEVGAKTGTHEVSVDSSFSASGGSTV